MTAAGESRFALKAVLILALVFLAYLPALRGQFVWDDALLIDQNSIAKGDLNLRSVWFHTDFPLTVVLFWLEKLLWGKHAAGYHLVNILLHAGGAILFWRALRRLGVRGAWLAGALFGVHPVCVASVAWISEAKNALSLPFFLLSLIWYLRFDEDAERAPTAQVDSAQIDGAASVPRVEAQRRFYWLALGAFVLALLSKTSTVMLPGVLLAGCLWKRGRLRPMDGLRSAPFFAFALGFGLATIWFQNHQAIQTEIVQTENFWGRLAGAGKALWFYLAKAFVPLNLNLIYPRSTIESTVFWSYLPGVAFLVCLGVCWWFRRTWGRAPLFALSLFAMLLFPVLGFFDMYFLAISRVSDHLQYLALLPILALVAGILKSRLPSVAPILGIVLLIALGFLTFQRAGILANGEKLWRDTLAKNPGAWPAENNLGCILAEQEKYDEALRHFTAAVQLNPRNPAAHCNLAKALSLQNRFAEAEPHFRESLSIKPQDPETQKAYGMSLAQQGRNDAALVHLREALRLRTDIETRLKLADIYYRIGRPADAVEQFHHVLAVNPNLVEALNNAAWLLATCADDRVRNGAEAIRLAEKACELTHHKSPVPLGTLAAAYAEGGRYSNAVVTAEQSVTVANETGAASFAALCKQLLEVYRAGKPWHERPR